MLRRTASAVLVVLLIGTTASAANPTINSTATKVMASDFFSSGLDWPHWGPEGNGTYYYPTGFVATDPQTGQDALFLFVQGGQTDAANLYIDDPGSQYSNCGLDEAIELIIPASSIGTRTDLIGTVFKPGNTIRVSDCTDQWGAGTNFRNHRNNDRFVILNTDTVDFQLIESPSSLGVNQYRTWINRRVLITGHATGADQPVHFDFASNPSAEYFSGSTLVYRDWEGMVRFQDDTSNPGALQVGRGKLRYSTYLYGTTNPWRVFIVDAAGNWHMVDPTTKTVDFDIRIYKDAMNAAEMFRNEFGWYEAWLVDFSQGRGSIPPGCSLTADVNGDGSIDYRRGFGGEILVYYRWWANQPTSSSGFGANKINLTNGSTPWSPYRPAHLDYAVGREGAYRLNYGGKRYLFTAHNDTNICDPQVGVWPDGSSRFINPYQGLYVTIEELSYYDAY